MAEETTTLIELDKLEIVKKDGKLFVRLNTPINWKDDKKVDSSLPQDVKDLIGE